MNTFKNKIKANFTALPNSIINDSELSWKAKGIFLYLASKPDDWNFYMEEIQVHSTDGITALRTGIKELIVQGYLERRKITNENGEFEGLEWILSAPRETRPAENPQSGKSATRKTYRYNNTDNTNTDNTNIKRTNSAGSKKPSIKQRNKKLLPFAKHLANTIKQDKNINTPSNRLDSWANEIRKLNEVEGVDAPRIKKALRWYRKNIGGQYIPVIESGASLREKFLKLERAMEANGYQNQSNKPATAYREKNKKYPKGEKI
jgi:hypothetical protein